MGYNLTIGEATAVVDLEERSAYVEAERLNGATLGAPLDPSVIPTHLNTCSPGYIVWHEFTKSVGLEGTFYGGRPGIPRECDAEGDSYDGLLTDGRCEALYPHHLVAFEAARSRWMAAPEATRSKACSNGVDWNQRRLDWLCWWTRWALENCEYPSMSQ